MWSLRLQKIIYAVRSSIGRRGLRLGVGASIEHRRALDGIDFQSVFDIGANRGQFALFAHFEFPNARIFSFEPLKAPAVLFRALFREESLVTLFPLALGSSAASTTINVTEQDDSSSILPIGENQARTFGTRSVTTEKIKIARFDQVISNTDIKPPALLKIDTQGYELEVLRGCGELLRAFAAVYVELSHVELYEGQPLAGEVSSYLEEHGFHCKGFFNEATDEGGMPIQADFLFLRAK